MLSSRRGGGGHSPRSGYAARARYDGPLHREPPTALLQRQPPAAQRRVWPKGAQDILGFKVLPLSDGIGLQASIYIEEYGVGTVADEIQTALSPQAEAHLASTRPVDPEAYEDYLRGHLHFQDITPSDLDAALEYFERALRRDSTYALAYAGIALVWGSRALTGIAPIREAQAHASADARKALALDSTLVQVQFSVAQIRMWHEWDWAGAETAFQKAIQINPNYPDVRAFYSQFLSIMGRPEEARAQMDSAVALDPYNGLFRAMNGVVLTHARRYEDAIAEHRRAQELGFIPGTVVDALDLSGALAEAIVALRQYVGASYAHYQEMLDALDRGYAEGGYRGANRSVARTLAARRTPAGMVANWYASARDEEHTLEWLERA